jgi:hypothetical protein
VVREDSCAAILLGDLDPAAVLQVRGDVGGAEGVAAYRRLNDGKSCDQLGEITRRHYLSAFVAAERQQPALVACDQIIGLARFGQRQEKIVRGIRRALDARQRIDVLGELFDLVDQAAGLVWFDEFGHTWLLQRGPQLVGLRCAGQERKFSVPARLR